MNIYLLGSKTKTKTFIRFGAAVILTILVQTHLAQAAGTGEATSAKEMTFAVQNTAGVSFADLQSNDPLVQMVAEYLEAKGSPLKDYAGDIVLQPRWQMALAVSFVESNFGKYCFDNNCSGIGVHPKHPSWRKYETKKDWFIDMAKLMDRPLYKEKYDTCSKMRGIYVVPGSDRWVGGCSKVHKELTAMTKLAEEKRTENIAETHNKITTSNQTLALVK